MSLGTCISDSPWVSAAAAAWLVEDLSITEQDGAFVPVVLAPWVLLRVALCITRVVAAHPHCVSMLTG